MRISKIEFEGVELHGGPIPTASMMRRHRGEYIFVEIHKVGGGCTSNHLPVKDADEALHAMARELQQALDGHEGTPGEIDEYYRELRRLAD